MKITVCELKNGTDVLEQEWGNLVNHVQSEGSDLVLLPEMPFYPWLAHTDQVDNQAWETAVEIHQGWLSRLEELYPALVAGTRPVIREGKHLNEGFIHDQVTGYTAVHDKVYLPNEEGWWEATWYQRGAKDFSLQQTSLGKIGFLICTELWFNEHARDYAKQGIELLVCPRATGMSTTDKWIAGGRTAAVVSGAFCLSSNFSYREKDKVIWGGQGWIIDPEGQVLGTTSSKQPFLTLEIDLGEAQAAKETYPRYVLD